MHTPNSPAHSAPPDFVIAGNIARDIVLDGWRLGGTAIYAASVARGLGRSVGLVTAATDDVAAAVPEGVQIARHTARESVSFENVYTDEGRIQYLRAAGERIPATTVPLSWCASRIALLGPVYHELGPDIAEHFTGIVGVCVQGFLRRTDTDARVQPISPESWNAAPFLRHARALFLSEEDLLPGHDNVVLKWARQVPLVAVTNGRAGAWVWAEGTRRLVPAFPAREVDPTGAGDAFATGVLVALDDGADPWMAARYGAAVASLVVETHGPVCPTRAQVAERLAQVGSLEEI